MMGLAPHIGRQQAHDIVYDACRVVNEQGGTLAEALKAMPEVIEPARPRAIDRLTDPSTIWAWRRRWSTAWWRRASAPAKPPCPTKTSRRQT